MADERPPYFLERPDAPSPSFGAVAQSGILPEVRQAQSGYQEAQKRRAENVGKRIAEEKQAITAVPHEAPPAEPTPIPRPPSAGLTPFLAPVEGERPENTIAKLIQGVGLLATGVAGRKDARASLAALTGALKGWQEGDKERADRHFADWQAQSETLLKNWQTKRARWKDLQDDRSLTFQERAKILELDLLKEGLPVDAAKANLEGWKYLQDLVDKQQAHADSIGLLRDKFADHRQQVDRAFNEKVREFNEKQKQVTDLDPVTLDYAANQMLSGHPPPLGMGGAALRIAIFKRTAQLAQERGLDPANIPSLQAGFRASETELKRIQSTRGPVMAFAKTIDKHMEQAVNLSDKRDATGVPAWNRWVNKGRMSIAGDPDITNFNFLLRETINEYAKATSSVSGGGAATSDTARKEIEDVLNSAMTKEQIISIFPQMKLALLNKQKGFEEQIGSTVEDMRGYFKGPGKAPAATPSPASPAATPGKPAVLVGPDGKRYDGAGVDATRLRPGWKLE